jgi:hypothetical protein
MLVWLDTLAGLSLLAVAAVGWRRFRTSALFAAAAAAAWFVVPLAPALVLLHRPLLLHSVLALPRRGFVGPLPWALLLAGWAALFLPLAAQPWVAVATAGLAAAVALRPSRLGSVAIRPVLLILATGLLLPVVERTAWPESADLGLPFATYLCTVILFSGAMVRAMLASGLHEADSVIELSDRTPDQTLAELRRLAAEEAGTTGGALGSALTLLEDNARLQRDLAERIEEVRASRARLIDAAVGERQRLERVLCEGALHYLDELESTLMSMTGSGPDPALTACLEEVIRLREDLEQLARGLHPRVLSDRGLAVALEQLARHSPVPVQMRVPSGRFPERTETTMWYACAEALANVWKHAQATQVQVHVEESPTALRAVVRDDGVGGASLSSGGGLAGLVDRLSDVEGRLSLASTSTGTDVTIEVPRR